MPSIATTQTQIIQKKQRLGFSNIATWMRAACGAAALSFVFSHVAQPLQIAKAYSIDTVLAASSTGVAHVRSERRTDIGILIIGGLQNKKENFLSYIDNVQAQFEKVRFEAIGQSMLNPDHIKDYHQVESAVAEMLSDGAQKIVVIGFSAGGKHAAKLAIEHNEIAGLVLLDPVDGGPQPNGKTPIFLKDGDIIAKPTMLLASEFGHIPKLLGQACAPEQFAHNHFRAHIETSHLVTDEVVAGTGHINFLTKPWAYLFALACDNGTADYLDAQKYILTKVTDFLATQF